MFLSCDTDSSIDAVLFLENLKKSNLIAETDHTSITNQELQVDNTSFQVLVIMGFCKQLK